jgi:prepilin-type N-terminal cleavage/methylation domain-containing protein
MSSKTSLFSSRRFRRDITRRHGFTLVELLVVIAIILVLTTLIVAGVKRAMLGAQKTQTMNLMRSVNIGLTAFHTEYSKPPLPDQVIAAGTDIVLGERGGGYSNAYIVAVLEGLGPDDTAVRFNFAGGEWQVNAVNKKLEAYFTFPRVQEKKNGAYDRRGDASELELFDAWGNTLMIALNVPPFQTDSQQGVRDRLCYTNTLADYSDTAPREENHVIWSYGKDGAKGNASDQGGSPSFRGSDDVISW